MKKNIIMCVFVIGLICLLLKLHFRNESEFINYNGALLAMTLTDSDGTRNITEFPTDDVYIADIECVNADGLWLPKDDGTGFEFSLENVVGNVKCNVAFTKVTNDNSLINHIEKIKLKTDTNNGICSKESYTTKSTCESNKGIWWGVFEENGLRYEGLDPENYIWFNNELWRIVGYIPTKDIEGNDTQLIKIVRAETIGGLTFNSSGSTYVNSRIYNLLNNYYYSRKTGTKSGYCYGQGSTLTTSCNYEAIGLNLTARKMTEPVQWAIGTQGTMSTAATHYTNETKTYTSVDGGINIGLLNASDFGYSVLAENCARTTSVSSYKTKNCSGTSWIYGRAYEWLMTPVSSTNVWSATNNGDLASQPASNGYSIRPALYLDSEVYVTSGSGKITDPYIVGLGLPPSLAVTASVINNNTASPKITFTVGTNGTYCVNTSSNRTDISSCIFEGNITADETITTNTLSSSGTYYVHVMDSNGDIGVSKAISVSIPNYVCDTNIALGTCLQSAKTSGFNSTIEAGLYRYQGTSGIVNNYVCFGTTDKSTCIGDIDKYMYRIIGVNSSGQVKIIKHEALNNTMQWHSDNSVTWPNSLAYQNINGSAYLTNISYMPSGWENKIATYSWKYGIVDSYSGTTTSANIYSIENGWSDSVSAKIGLMYIHDYLYALENHETINCLTSSETCKTAWIHIANCDLTNCSSTGCGNGSPSLYDKVITRTSTGGWLISAWGTVSSGLLSDLHSMRPVFFLTTSVKYISGSGTMLDPFIVS